VGADAAQTSSWVAALCLAMAATSGFLSLRHRIPDRHGLVDARRGPDRRFQRHPHRAAVGAFLLAAALILLTAASGR
jgi:benzoate membrane transport protein